MFIFDMTNLLTLFLVLIATILFIYLSQETKKSVVFLKQPHISRRNIYDPE